MPEPVESINLDTDKLGAKAEEVLTVLKSRLVGQDSSCESVARSLNLSYSGLANPNRPRLVILAAGVTGVGKTFLARSLAFALYGNADDLVMVHSGAMSEKHIASATLLGSPPGYVGFRDTPALLSPQNINRLKSIKPTKYNSSGDKEEFVEGCIIVIDEVEKADSSLHQTILGLLDSGQVTLSNNTVVDLRSAIIIMTSNCGTVAAQKFEETGSMGFVQGEKESSDAIIMAEIERRFSPEFLGRIDKIVIFQPLSRDSVRRILSLRIEALEKQITASNQPFVLQISVSTQDALLTLCMDQGGARQVNRVVERYIAEPIAACISSQQVTFGDLVLVQGSEAPFSFRRIPGGGFIVNGEKTVHVKDGKVTEPKPEPEPISECPKIKPNPRAGDQVIDWLLIVQDESEIPAPCPPDGVDIDEWFRRLPSCPVYPYVGSPEGKDSRRPDSLFS